MPLQVKSNLRTFNVNKIPSQPKRRKKVNLVFDENKRREFLGGFRKRKLERQKKAKEELQQKLKEEKKRIKQDARERFKKLLSSRDVPELQELLSKEEYQMEGHTVSILEVDIADLAGNSLIGKNKVVYEDTNKDKESSDESEADEEEVPGMTLKKVQNIPQKKVTEPIKKFESKKELKREIKKAALKQVKKSKAFQQKQRLEHEKNKKLNRRKQMKEKKSQKDGKFKRKRNH